MAIRSLLVKLGYKLVAKEDISQLIHLEKAQGFDFAQAPGKHEFNVNIGFFLKELQAGTICSTWNHRRDRRS